MDNIDGPKGYLAKVNQSDREGQKPYDCIFMWTLKSKINEQIKQKQINRYGE